MIFVDVPGCTITLTLTVVCERIGWRRTSRCCEEVLYMYMGKERNDVTTGAGTFLQALSPMDSRIAKATESRLIQWHTL